MKKLFATALIGMMAASAFADVTTVPFSYANDDVFNYGKGRKISYDVAMCINDPSLAGKKITKISAYLATMDINETSIWMTDELIVDGKLNVPNIMSQDVTPVEATYGDKTGLALLQYELAEPYVLTGDPVYVGYSVNIPDTETNEQKNPLVLSNVINENGFWLHSGAAVLRWTEYSQTAGGVAVIVVDLEGEFPTNSLSASSLGETFAVNGEPFDVVAYFTNTGQSPINNINYTYTSNGVTKDGYMELESPIEPNPALPCPVALPFEAINGSGPYDISITLTKVNGEENQTEFPTLEGKVYVAPYLPKHRPLVEEYTGTWCGYCTRGYIGMELVGEFYGEDVTVICYHDQDPMAVNPRPYVPSGDPAATLDRLGQIDPYYGTLSTSLWSNLQYDFYIRNDIDEALTWKPLADINIIDAYAENNQVKVSTEVMFIKDFDKANYQIGYVLVANGLSGKPGSSWDQHNYYAGDKDYAGTYLQPICEWPAVVQGLVFNDVAIDSRMCGGVSGSIPSKITTGETIAHQYTFNIGSNQFAQKLENLSVAAFIIDRSNGTIENSHRFYLRNGSGVEGIESNAHVMNVEYYDLNGRKVVNPEKGIFVKVAKMSDGSVKTSKVVK